jgi:hypothetical protein
MGMADDDEGPKQLTPEGYEIPVPKRADIMRSLQRIANPPTPEKDSGAAKESGDDDAAE